MFFRYNYIINRLTFFVKQKTKKQRPLSDKLIFAGVYF